VAQVERLQIGNALDMKELPIGSLTRVGDLLYTYGMISVSPETGEVLEGDVKSQTRRVMENLKLALESGGSSFEHVVMVTIFLANIREDFDAFNEVYADYFPVDAPTRYCVGATLAWPELLVEIQMVAALPDS